MIFESAIAVICTSLAIASATQLNIQLGQVETASSLGNLTLYPLDIRADALRDLLQEALADLKAANGPHEPSYYQFNGTDWLYEISGASELNLTGDDYVSITERAIDLAPPSSQAFTQTVIGTVSIGGQPMADVVINPLPGVNPAKDFPTPQFPNDTSPTAPVSVLNVDKLNDTSPTTEIPQNDPSLHAFLAAFASFSGMDLQGTTNSSSATSGSSAVGITNLGGSSNLNATSSTANSEIPSARFRRRGSRLGRANTFSNDDEENQPPTSPPGDPVDKQNKILSVRRSFPLGNTGFGVKLWFWRDESSDVPVVCVTEVKHMRAAIHAFLNSIPLEVEYRRRNNIRPFNELARVSSSTVETPEGTDVEFTAWSARSIYDGREEDPTKLTDEMWVSLAQGLLAIFKSMHDEDMIMALEGLLMNTAVHGEPEPFGFVKLTAVRQKELLQNGPPRRRLTEQGSGITNGTIMQDGAAVARRALPLR